jgi:hypothetical protein
MCVKYSSNTTLVLEKVKYTFPLVFSPEGTFSLLIISFVCHAIWKVQDGMETCDYCIYGYCTFHIVPFLLIETLYRKLCPKTWKIQSLLAVLQHHSHIYFVNFLITYASNAGTETILAKSQHTAANMERTLNEQNEEK